VVILDPGMMGVVDVLQGLEEEGTYGLDGTVVPITTST